MASTNFLIFDEGKQNMMSDGDYSANTQRARGVTPGIAYPNLHNKLYYQVSVMAKAIADFMVAQGANASDEDVEQLTADISTAFTNFVDNKTKDVYLPLSGGTMKGNINANGYNITATKFIGNLQGKADSAANADLAAKANQDSQGQTINTTYVKDVTASNATLTITKGNGTTSTATINNVANATKATQDGDGNTINTTYLKLSGGTMKGNIYFTGVTSGIQRIIKNTEFDSGITFTPDFMGFWDWRDNTRVLTYNYNKKELTAGVAINGVTPSTSDNSTKLATTAFVQSLLTNKFTASKQQNGWWKDGNTGMIWQWGVVKESSSSSDYKYFPISFPNSCFIVIGVIIKYPVSDFFTPWAYPVDKTKFLIGAEKDYTSVYNMGYIAIGY